MNVIYTEVNKRTDGKYRDLRFANVSFAKTATVTVVCKKSDSDFVYANKSELTGLLSDICGFHRPIDIVINSEPPTDASLRAAVVAFTEKFNYVSSMLHTVTAETKPNKCVKLKMHNAMYELAQNDYIPRLKEFLSDNFADEIAVDVEIVEFSRSGTASAAASGGGRAEYGLRNITPVIGSLTVNKARSVMSITEAGYNVAVCGVLVMPTYFTGKSGRPYEKFLLYDGDMSIQCRLTEGSIYNRDLVNKTVCVLGNVEYESARNEATVTVRELSLCDADGLAPIPVRAVPTQYTAVQPKDYAEYVQSSMFENNVAVPPSLKGDFVVFDFETTGLSVLYDRPTELGAVKISDGFIKESFSSLIDPRRDIPPEVSEKTGITNEMVKGQPLFEDILPDFYKFTYGCSVVCHNIAFDFPFLIRGGNRTGWAFGDRKTYDTMGLAPKALPGIARLSLDKVLEALGLSNDNAHRALSDAVATAKAFIAMQKRIGI